MMLIFEESTTFTPSDYGLASGDIVEVICVGGGSSGICRIGSSLPVSNNGGASSFGSYVTALGGVADASGGVGLAKGGVSVYSSNDLGNIAGGGAGGFYPAVPEVTGSPYITSSDRPNGAGCNAYDADTIRSVFGGGEHGVTCCKSSTTKNLYNNDTAATDGSYFGVGAKGGRAYTVTTAGGDTKGIATFAGSYTGDGSISWTPAGGGAGYGAGGGGCGCNGSAGGASGNIKKGIIKLQSNDAIAVTVGAGGAEAVSYMSSLYTFTNGDIKCIAGAGADGCVIVCF